MTTTAQSWNSEKEADFLDRLRVAYEKQGYKFIIHPGMEIMPGFLSGFEPDAIAEKGNEKVIIVVMVRGRLRSDKKIAQMQEQIAKQPGWRLDVFHIDETKPNEVEILPAESDSIQKQIDEVRQLQRGEFSRAAFLMAWAILEASFNRVNKGSNHRSQSAGQLVQSLAMDGHIDSQDEREFRTLAMLRNKIAHGDLSANASTQDIEEILKIAQKMLLDKQVSSV